LARESISLLMALALAAEDEEAARRVLEEYARGEITLREAIERLKHLPRKAIIV